MWLRVRSLSAVALALMLFSVHVESRDVPNSADHPLIKRYEGSTIAPSRVGMGAPWGSVLG